MPRTKPVWDRYESDDFSESDDDDDAASSYHPDGSITAEELSLKPHACTPCGARFRTKKELRNHKIRDAEHHEFCADCDRDFETHADLQMHLIKSPLHIICVDCFKEFKSVGGLEGHRKQMHRVSQRLHCPGCNAAFLNASGITQHVEGNGCHAGLTNAVLTRKIIQSSDPTSLLDLDPERKPNTTTTHIWRDGIVPPYLKQALNEASANAPPNRPTTTAADMPGWHTRNQGGPAAAKGMSVVDTGGGADWANDNSNRPSVLDYTVGMAGAVEEAEPRLGDMAKYWANDIGQFRCPFNSCGKKFYKAHGMLQHVTSSTHARKVFRCPTCCDRYRSASALLQHMESGSCGINDTAQALEVTKSLTGGIIY